jgi:hypothetical protein
MSDSFPAGASIPASIPASTSAELERWYRRLVACYPRSFRSQNTEEIITVLLATAGEGQRRPSLAEAADLLRGAARMRTGMSRSPRTVRNAVRLMWLGAIAQLATVMTVLVTADSIKAAVRSAVTVHDPAAVAYAVSLVNMNVFVDVVLTPFVIAGWLVVAWANGKGYAWGRPAAIIAFAFSTVGVILRLMEGDATYAPAAMIALGVLWSIGLAATVLLLMKQSWPYYESQINAAISDLPSH